ncbi:MAG: DJ-1/PfpI family protein [Candidatus Competibacteraceae bacterium]|nr:DJ-1/PfpI family protein [Candidatus Competibacteraceae bacterium]
MSQFPAHWHGSEKIAFLLYPQFTALDVVGPHYMLASLMGSTTYLVAKTKDPVASDLKLAIVPSTTFDDCPADLDILVVPGGSTGTLDAMKDAATLAFVKDRGSRAKYVCSVCTGSLLLGAAGLLQGYKATSHWLTRDVLADFGAIPIDERVVIDRNRVTGAGVTAGIDFGLTLVRERRDETYAKVMQLLAEYHPVPPFDAGTPERAGPGPTAMLSEMLKPFIADVRNFARGG